VRKVGGLMSGLVRSKTEKLVPVASLGDIHHLGASVGLVGPVSV